MAEYLIQDTTLDAIADAINAKTGGSSAMTPAQMVTAIGTISGGGGLPSPVTAIKTGSFTLAEDIAANNSYNLQHDLGVVPQLIFVWCEGFTSQLRDYNTNKTSMIVLAQVGNDDVARNWLYAGKYSSSSGNMLTFTVNYVRGDVTNAIAKIHSDSVIGSTLTTGSGTAPATWRWIALDIGS